MIRILHVVNLPGSNHWLNGIADHYDRTRFEHLVVSTGPRNGLHDELEKRGIKSLELNAKNRWQLSLGVTKLIRIIRRERIDIVQTHTFGPTSVGLVAAKAAGKPRTLLTRHHADFTTLFDKPIHRRIDRWHALTADRVLSPSHFIEDCMVRYEGVPRERITVLPHGFDFDRMKPSLPPDERRQLRESVGGDDHFLIGMVARLSIEKAHEVLIRAVPEVVRAYPKTRFVIIGAGPRQAELEQMTRDAGVVDSVRFLGWRWDAWNLIEAMDLIAHPSLREPFGIVYVESMALEKAVITTTDGAAAEIIDDAETGILLPPRDSAALARAIIDLRASPDRARDMGREARRRVISRFNFPKIMNHYEDLYRSLVH